MRILPVGEGGRLSQYFQGMGAIHSAEITPMNPVLMGEPMESRIHGYELSLRLADADTRACG